MRKVIWGLSLFFVIVFICKSATDPRQDESSPNQAKLKEILQKTGEYCRRLENAVFNFVCLEEIVEKIKGPQEVAQRAILDRTRYSLEDTITHYSLTEKPEKNKYLYEYQLIRKQGQNEERRTLLEKNGSKKVKKNAHLEVVRFYYEKMAFGPIDLLSGLHQLRYDFKIVNEEMLNQEELAVTEAAPKISAIGYTAFGKIWVRESDFAILKIEWDEKSLGNYQAIEERAAQLTSKPKITLTTEFGIEKNGIRFPSRVVFEEAYINRQGKKLVASEVTITYKDYKFFIVEVDVKY
jgi:hypothetical protein